MLRLQRVAWPLASLLLVLVAACGDDAGPQRLDATATKIPFTATAAVSQQSEPTAAQEPAQSNEGAPDAGGPHFDPVQMRCVGVPAPTIDREWQVSAPRGLPGPVRPGEVVELGLRNKFGMQDESYYGGARVVAPDGTSFVATTLVEADAWGDVLYPTDFAGGVPLVPGTYTVIWEIDGGFVACDGFVVEPF